MKVEDLRGTDLVGVKVRIPKKFEDTYQKIEGDMYIYSWWYKGVWFKKSMDEERIYPLCINPEEVLNFTVIKEK